MLDSLRGHTAASLRVARAAGQGAGRFLPPSAPAALPPIAQALSPRTARRRGREARPRAVLVAALRLAVAAVTRHDALAWFAHAGSVLPDHAS